MPPFRDAKAGHTHYGDPKGDPELIDAVCRAWEEDFGQRLPRDHVLVSASSCLGMALVMLAILDPGDEVIVFSPYFPMYREQIELAGGVCVDVPTYASEDYRHRRGASARRHHPAHQGHRFQQSHEPHRHGLRREDARAARARRAGARPAHRRRRDLYHLSLRGRLLPRSARCPAWPSAPSRSTAFPRIS